jgi:hypothetical protein
MQEFQSMDPSPPSGKMGKRRIYFGGPFQNSYIVFIAETDPFSGTLLALYHSLLHKKKM